MTRQVVKLPKTTLEQRSRFYADVEEMLNPGFLSLPVQVGDVRINLRSPTPGDLYLIRQRAKSGSDLDWARWSLATCTWMVDGYIVDDVNASVELRKLYSTLPDYGFSKIFSGFLSLFSRAREAVADVYHYCNESTSRMKWYQMSRFGTGLGVTGVPGQDGLNMVQRIWTAYNHIEDRRDEDDREWQRAKFIASTQAPKYIQQINNREKALQDEQEWKKQEELDSFFYQKIGVLSEGDKIEGGSSDGMRIPMKTVDQLNAEYWSWVNEEYDEHDKIIQNYKQSLQDEYDRRKRERREQWDLLEQQIAEQEEEIWEDSPIEALTHEELQNRLAGRSRVRRVYDDEKVKAQEHVLKTHLEVVESRPHEGMTFDEETGSWKAPKRNLAEDISSRVPTLHTTGS